MRERERERERERDCGEYSLSAKNQCIMHWALFGSSGRAHVRADGGHGPPKFLKKKIDILKYELSQPIKQFSRLIMLLAPSNSEHIFKHSPITIISTNKRKKKILVKK